MSAILCRHCHLLEYILKYHSCYVCSFRHWCVSLTAFYRMSHSGGRSMWWECAGDIICRKWRGCAGLGEAKKYRQFNNDDGIKWYVDDDELIIKQHNYSMVISIRVCVMVAAADNTCKPRLLGWISCMVFIMHVWMVAAADLRTNNQDTVSRARCQAYCLQQVGRTFESRSEICCIHC